MAGIKDIKFLTRPIQKFRNGGGAAVIPYRPVRSSMNVPNPAPYWKELMASQALLSYPTISALTEAEARDRGIIIPPEGKSEEEKRKEVEPVGGGFTSLSDEDKLPQSTAGEIPKVDTNLPPTTTKPEEKAEPVGGGFTELEDKDKLPTIITMAKGDLSKGEIYGVPSRKVLTKEQKEKLDEVLENIRTGEITAKEGAKQSYEFAPGFGFYSPGKIKRGQKGVEGDKWKQVVDNYNKQFDDALFTEFTNKKISAENRNISPTAFEDFTPQRPTIKRINDVIKIAEAMPSEDSQGNKIDFGMRFANAYKNYKLGEDVVIPKGGMNELFGSGDWSRARALADDILKYQGKSDSAYMKYPKNSYRSKDGTSLEYQVFGGSVGENTLNEAMKQAGFNADQRFLITNWKKNAIDTAGKSTRDENYINQVSITSAMERLIMNGLAQEASPEEIIKKINNSDPSEFGKVINKNRELRNKFKMFSEQFPNLKIEDFNLSHMEAIADNWRTGLQANNLYFQEEAKNVGLQKQINTDIVDFLRNLEAAKKVEGPAGIAKIKKLKKEFKSLSNLLKKENIVSIIDGKKIGATDIDYLSSAERLEQEMTTKAKQAISEKMFGDPTYYKNGGIVEISHLIRPL